MKWTVKYLDRGTRKYIVYQDYDTADEAKTSASALTKQGNTCLIEHDEGEEVVSEFCPRND